MCSIGTSCFLDELFIVETIGHAGSVLTQVTAVDAASKQ